VLADLLINVELADELVSELGVDQVALERGVAVLRVELKVWRQSSVLQSFTPGLPDDVFSYQKILIWGKLFFLIWYIL
jgi:hypothetical protein